jgi:lysophospholipid acyltransferase (LPLAT)-like uncharacterized protein
MGLKQALASVFGALLIRTWRLTWRIDEQPPRAVLRRREAGPGGAVWIMWHSRILLGAATQADQGMHVLISMHGDGELIASTVAKMGFTPIRGSSSRRGREALHETVRALTAGGQVAFTPDGPRGPRMTVQAGCVVAAMRAGVPLIPVGFEASSSKRLRSWDRFVLPLPFARVAVRFGEPIDVPESLSSVEIEALQDRVRDALVEVTAEAAAAVGVRAETPDVDPLSSPS